MHVDEGSAFSPQHTIKLEVVSARGDSRTFEVTTDLGVDKLKLMALTHIHHDPMASVKMSQQFKLVSIGTKKALNDEASLRDEEIGDGDIILLLLRCPPSSSSLTDSTQKELRGRGPSEGEIISATANLPPKNMDRKTMELAVTQDFPKELRKILVSLISFTEKLLRSHPEVEPILRDMKPEAEVAAIQKKADDSVNREALQQLMDMGFPCERAKRALKLNKMSPLEAMDWLLAYESTSVFTSSAGSVVPLAPSSSSAAPASSTRDAVPSCDSPSNVGIYPNVPAIVESYRVFKRKLAKPNAKAYANLKQMGFDENEVLDALWVHCNNEVSACEWLLSDRRPKLDDLRKGLKLDSPIYKALISNAAIQLGLVKPKTFFSFLQLLEDPNGTGKWLSDPETSPILSQIFRIFHSEKHAAAEHLAVTTSASPSPEAINPMFINRI